MPTTDAAQTSLQSIGRQRSDVSYWHGPAALSALSLALKDWGASSLKEQAMLSHQKSSADVTAIGIDIGKNTFHLIGQDRRGKVVMRARVSRAQLMERLVNVPRCLIGMEAGAGAHHIARQLIEIRLATRGRTIHFSAKLSTSQIAHTKAGQRAVTLCLVVQFCGTERVDTSACPSSPSASVNAAFDLLMREAM